jgi:O-antigen ligase
MIFGALVVVIVLALLRDTIMGRLLTANPESAEARVYLNQLAFRIIRANPLLGVGTNNFTVVMRDYITPDLGAIWIYAVHNTYLLTWSEAGFGALVTFVLFLLNAIRRGWARVTSLDHLLSPIALGLIAALAGHMVHMLVDVFSRGAPVELLWFYAGLTVAMSFSIREGW